MKIGVIGTGSMGTILIESFLDANVLTEDQLLITNRTIDKAFKLKDRFPAIHVVDLPTVIKETDIFFLCMKPPQIPSVVNNIAPYCRKEQILVSITSPISVKQLEELIDCKVARAIPSILNRALTGSSLLSFGDRCDEVDQEKIMNLMGAISEPLMIEETITRVSSDIVSCGPAFFSYLMQQFIDAAVRQTNISKEDATTLTTNMLIGMGTLLKKGFYTLPTLQERVCVPGGITGEGIKVLEQEVGLMFDHLFQRTHEKYEEERAIIAATIKSDKK